MPSPKEETVKEYSLPLIFYVGINEFYCFTPEMMHAANILASLRDKQELNITFIVSKEGVCKIV